MKKAPRLPSECFDFIFEAVISRIAVQDISDHVQPPYTNNDYCEAVTMVLLYVFFRNMSSRLFFVYEKITHGRVFFVKQIEQERRLDTVKPVESPVVIASDRHTKILLSSWLAR